MTAVSYRKVTDLPQTIALFPLTGALLFPRANLPLNIFEPRYLNMVDDAMRGDRLIGMIQPAPGEEGGEAPPLAKVGCVGRIVSYSETDDGRYLISLKGVCRFKLTAETDEERPYRRAAVDFACFDADLKPLAELANQDAVREDLLLALKSFLGRNGLKTDWSAVGEASLDTLTHALASGCPFSPAEKQLLLEAEMLKDRCDVLAALLRVNSSSSGGMMQ